MTVIMKRDTELQEKYVLVYSNLTQKFHTLCYSIKN